MFVSQRARPPSSGWTLILTANRRPGHSVSRRNRCLISLIHPAPAADAPAAVLHAAEFTFNGLTLPLESLPSTAAEQAFATSFPGSLSSHRWGENQVILRRVTTATRKLHPSRDCLRAAGFETIDSVTVRTSGGGEWSRVSRNSEESPA